MNLKYVYNNNSNLKYTLKAYSLFGMSIILMIFLMQIIDKNIDYSFILMFSFTIIMTIIFFDIVFLIIITMKNNYKRKQFATIKDKGKYYDGIIIMANRHSKGYGRHKWLWKTTGEITVSVENKTYTITDIDYNNEFKLLEQKLKDNFKTNRQQYMNLNQQIKNNDILGNIFIKEITIGIYILDNKVVADLNSIKCN